MSGVANASAAGGGGSSKNNSNNNNNNNNNRKWKNPTPQHQQKYGLVALPDDFESTKEEDILMDMYQTIQTYERTAARLKEEAARARLAARDAEFHQKLAPAKKNKRKRQKKKPSKEKADDDSGADESDEDDEGSAGSDEGDSDDEDRAEAKLAQLREQVEEAKSGRRDDEERRLREELLQTQTDIDYGEPMLKRKKIAAAADNDDEFADAIKPASSLIANLTGGATPPHDFSKKYGLTAVHGKVLFPTSADNQPAATAKWTPPDGVFSPNDGAFVVELDHFDVAKAQHGQGNNTVAIKFMAPSDSKRFSINIARVADKDQFESVLFHFNPRHHERGGQLVINDKQSGIWGQALAIPLSQVPLVFGQTSCTLVIQINGEGFDVFLEGKHIARLEHRVELPSGTAASLVLQFPSTDDYGSAENWVVYKVWWGKRPNMASKSDDELSHVAGVDSYNALHPRKLFVSGLAKIHTEPEVDLRRAELERAFRKYGGDRGVAVIVPTNVTYAFVEMESERQTDLALSEMSGQYRLNRARRSRHEALQEERAAAEARKSSGAATGAAAAAGGGKAASAPGAKKDTKDWD